MRRIMFYVYKYHKTLLFSDCNTQTHLQTQIFVVNTDRNGISKASKQPGSLISRIWLLLRFESVCVYARKSLLRDLCKVNDRQNIGELQQTNAIFFLTHPMFLYYIPKIYCIRSLKKNRKTKTRIRWRSTRRFRNSWAR